MGLTYTVYLRQNLQHVLLQRLQTVGIIFIVHVAKVQKNVECGMWNGKKMATGIKIFHFSFPFSHFFINFVGD